MFELRCIYVQGQPKAGDIHTGGQHSNIWQRLQYRAKPADVDEPFDHKNEFGAWMDVPFGGLATPPGDG